MQITSGSAKGLKIKVPANKAIRPSQNQVRLALFSILESNYLPESGYQSLFVADLFAGTGTLGIEALSRGVQHVDFVEKDPNHANLLKENLHKAGFTERSSVIQANVTTFVQRQSIANYDIVFLDPPYKLFDSIDLTSVKRILKPSGTLIYLHDAHNIPQPQIIDSDDTVWQRSEPRQYGATGVSFYIRLEVEAI